MPAKAEWLLRVPEILVALRVLDVPVVDRAAIQRLFGFQRRRAIQFMHELDGYQAGHSFLVDRLRLIAQLEVLQNGDAFHQENRRRTNLEETAEHARATGGGDPGEDPFEAGYPSGRGSAAEFDRAPANRKAFGARRDVA